MYTYTYIDMHKYIYIYTQYIYIYIIYMKPLACCLLPAACCHIAILPYCHIAILPIVLLFFRSSCGATPVASVATGTEGVKPGGAWQREPAWLDQRDARRVDEGQMKDR